MTFSLRRLAREAGHRRNIVLRPIEVTHALKKDLYRLTVIPVRAWEREVAGRILPAYERAVSLLTRDDESDDMAQILSVSEAIVAGALVRVTAEVERWFGEAVAWHEARWAAAVKAGTGIDVFPYIDRVQSRAGLRAFLKRITSLIRDIDAQARKDIEEIVWRGLTDQTPRPEMGKAIAERLGVARRRANMIAIDQAQKLSGEITRIRMLEAGLRKYRWRHSGKVHFRPEHKARDGKVYQIGQPVNDLPGLKPYCGCIQLPIIDVEEDDA